MTTADQRQVVIDLARDAGPLGVAMITAVGPTYPPQELAARKVLALFDRAALRDFIDVAAVAEQIDMDELLGLAATIDAGFDEAVLAEMIATLHRFTDEEIRAYGADPAVLRAFFADQ